MTREAAHLFLVFDEQDGFIAARAAGVATFLRLKRGGRGARKQDPERGACAGLTRNRNMSVPLLHDGIDGGQPKTRSDAGFLRRKKGFKDFI